MARRIAALLRRNATCFSAPVPIPTRRRNTCAPSHLAVVVADGERIVAIGRGELVGAGLLGAVEIGIRMTSAEDTRVPLGGPEHHLERAVLVAKNRRPVDGRTLVVTQVAVPVSPPTIDECREMEFPLALHTVAVVDRLEAGHGDRRLQHRGGPGRGHGGGRGRRLAAAGDPRGDDDGACHQQSASDRVHELLLPAEPADRRRGGRGALTPECMVGVAATKHFLPAEPPPSLDLSGKKGFTRGNHPHTVPRTRERRWSIGIFQ